MQEDDLNLNGQLGLGSEEEDTIEGSSSDDVMEGRAGNDRLKAQDGADRVHGEQGSDDLSGDAGSDLLVGDRAGSEWSLVNGKWVYDPVVAAENAAKSDGIVDESDDIIKGGDGEDVILGNGGQDKLYGNHGEDTIVAGKGDDSSFGGADNDVIHAEAGDDHTEGGLGADTVNAGDGDDVVYGDNSNDNLIANADIHHVANTFADHAATGGWEALEGDTSGMTQRIMLEAGETHQLSFNLAANMAGGSQGAAIEVLYGDEVVGTFETTSGAFETHNVTLEGTGEIADLTFRVVQDAALAGPQYNTDGPIMSYDKMVEIGGEEVSVAAFAPGQANLYQVISGDLRVFDPASNTYENVGDSTGFKINGIGFNVEDDLIYGIAKSAGTDALGNPVATKDLVMMDANGAVYRVGETDIGDYIGDFDASGNLWTAQGTMNRLTKIDVDNLDANGDPVQEHFYLPKDFLKGNIYDMAYSAKDNAFYAVEPPKVNGEAGKLHKISLEGWDGTDTPQITSIDISSTMIGETTVDGMAKGAYGAVFIDGDGNLYAGLNNGDHDLGVLGEGASMGAIYRINADFEAGTASAEFMAASDRTGSNDGAVDPRSMDAFQSVDVTAEVLIREPVLTSIEGGDDDLRGNDGEDEIHGGYGDDTIHGGADNDLLYGDQGKDLIMGGEGVDTMSGGEGDDFLIAGGTSGDSMSGDAGDDKFQGGVGQDTMEGGDGNDKVWARAGDDSIHGGDGEDELYGQEGDDTVNAGYGNDTVYGGDGNDSVQGGFGKDFILGGAGSDVLRGGGDVDKLVGGYGDDTIEGGSGNDHMWGGKWWKDRGYDTFVYTKGGGTDIIHDFETDFDKIDLSEYGLDFESIAARMTDYGWATGITLTGIAGSGATDKILIKSVKPDDLDETNFIT